MNLGRHIWKDLRYCLRSFYFSTSIDVFSILSVLGNSRLKIGIDYEFECHVVSCLFISLQKLLPVHLVMGFLLL